MLESFN